MSCLRLCTRKSICSQLVVTGVASRIGDREDASPASLLSLALTSKVADGDHILPAISVPSAPPPQTNGVIDAYVASSVLLE